MKRASEFLIMNHRNDITKILVLACLLYGMAFVSDAAQQSSGSVVVWGNQLLPVLQPGTRYTAVAAGAAHNLALRSDHTLVSWGHDRYSQCRAPAGATNLVAVAGGSYH